jgi:hypothetical protein
MKLAGPTALLMRLITWVVLIATASGCAKTVTVCDGYGSRMICREVDEKVQEKRDEKLIEDYKKIQKRELDKLLRGL